jgi:hypothetical protein
LCCSVKATIHSGSHHRAHGATKALPISAYYRDTRRTAVKAEDITDVLRCTMIINYSNISIKAREISARSLWAGGAMVLIFWWIDLDSIRMMGRWHINVMMRYLHIQAQPIINNYAARMCNCVSFDLFPDDTVPIIYNYGNH